MTRPCGRGVKRRAEVSRRARGWAERVSKADLLEAALSLASLCSGADSSTGWWRRSTCTAKGGAPGRRTAQVTHDLPVRVADRSGRDVMCPECGQTGTYVYKEDEGIFDPPRASSAPSVMRSSTAASMGHGPRVLLDPAGH
jgi:hypothetical protein